MYKYNKGDKATLTSLVHENEDAQKQYPLGCPIVIKDVITRNGKGAVYWSKEGEQEQWLASITDIKPR